MMKQEEEMLCVGVALRRRAVGTISLVSRGSTVVVECYESVLSSSGRDGRDSVVGFVSINSETCLVVCDIPTCSQGHKLRHPTR